MSLSPLPNRSLADSPLQQEPSADAMAEAQRVARQARNAAREERRRESRQSSRASSRGSSSEPMRGGGTPGKTPPWVKMRRAALQRAELEAAADGFTGASAVRAATPTKPVVWEQPTAEEGCCKTPKAIRRIRDRAEDEDKLCAKLGLCCGILLMCVIAVGSIVTIVSEGMDTCLGRLDGEERPYLLAQLPRPGQVSVTDMTLYEWLFWGEEDVAGGCSEGGLLPCLRLGEAVCDAGCYKVTLVEAAEDTAAGPEETETYPTRWVDGIVKSAQFVAVFGLIFAFSGLIFTGCACHRLKARARPKEGAYLDELGRP